MDWLRSEDLKEEKVLTAPTHYCSSRIYDRLIHIDQKTAGTREIMSIWAKEKQQSNQPKRHSPKSSRKWRIQE